MSLNRRRCVLGLLLIGAACGAGRVWSAETAAARPNILVVLSDDMGYSDLGCYGGEIQTPHLDQLATHGIRFTQFYNTARCCPTRASLLTGLYPHQAGVGHMMDDRGRDGYRGELNRRSVTFAELLKTAGYRTYMCGKWHVTKQIQADGDSSNWPVQRGFDKFYGTITGAGSFYDPTTLCRQNQFITPENDPDYQPEKYYYTHALSDNAIRYLQQHQAESADQPFLMYLAYTCAHWPMHALPEDIAKYRSKYDGGYETIRRARWERMKQLGVIAQDAALSPQAERWDDVQNREWEARGMEVYAAMIDAMDQGIGRIADQLKASGQWDNTLIFYMQDNGGCAEPLGRQSNGSGPADLKPLGRDGLQPRVTPPMQTRDGRWVRTGPEVMPGPEDTYIAYGRGWANVSNTPFREYKHWTHEGGISTPLIAHWPRGIGEARRGGLEHQPGHLIDIMATCVAVSGANYPREFAGSAIRPLEGISLTPVFAGEPLRRPQPLFWEHEGNRAVRSGPWKLVAKENEAWELYNIDNDRSELQDLAAQDEERVRSMSRQWQDYATRADVLPVGAWRGESGKAGKRKKKQ